MTKNKPYVPPNVMPKPLRAVGSILRKRWVRQLILLPSTLTRRRFSNKTEDYGVFAPSRIERLDQLSIYVKNIARSRLWYERVAGMTHSRTAEREPHPFREGYQIRCCYMNGKHHPECLVLTEEYDPDGNITTPSGMSFFHAAFELEDNSYGAVVAFTERARQQDFRPHYGPVVHNSEPPRGDGETGGNAATYFYDPDYHNIEFCGGMDTIDNYRERYGDRRGSERTG